MLIETPISSIKPFDHIECVVCGEHTFSWGGPGTSPECPTCGASYKMDSTSGDPGCVVRCNIDTTFNSITMNGYHLRYRTALIRLGYLTGTAGPLELDRIRPYRILKSPDTTGWCEEDSGWIVLLRAKVGLLHPSLNYIKSPLVPQEAAICAGRD